MCEAVVRKPAPRSMAAPGATSNCCAPAADSIPILDFRWDYDTVQVIGLPVEFERRANMKAEIRRRLLQDLAVRNGYPGAVDHHLVVIIDLSA